MTDTKVQDVMTHLAVTLDPECTIHEAAARMAQNRISGAPVVSGGRVVGILTEYDVIHAVSPPSRAGRHSSVLDLLSILTVGHARPRVAAMTVGSAMTTAVHTISPDASVCEAATILERRGIKRLPVVDEEGYLVGILSRADLIRAMGRDDATIAADVSDAIGVLGAETVEGARVRCDDGRVMLGGTVDRKSTKRIAAAIARRVPGVIGLKDEMSFEWDDEGLAAPGEPVPESFLQTKS